MSGKQLSRDHVRTVTHWASALLDASENESIPPQQVRTKVAEKTDLTGDDISRVIDNSQEIVLSGSSHTQIGGVDTVGDQPDAVEEYRNEHVSTGSSRATNTGTIQSIADFSELTDVNENQAELLRDEGYTSFHDLVEAPTDDLASIPTITTPIAESIAQEAKGIMPPAEFLARQNIERTRRYRERAGADPAGDTPIKAISTQINDVDQAAPPPLDPRKDHDGIEHAHIHGLPVLQKSDHPQVDDPEEFEPIMNVETESGDTVVEAICDTMARNNYVVHLEGHAGTAKSRRLKWVGSKTRRPTLVINLDDSMISQELLGIHTIEGEQNVIWKDGPIPAAVRNGYLLILDELRAAPPGILPAINQIAERNPKLYIKERDEVIEPHPQFRLAATSNPATDEYGAMKELDHQLKRRLKTYWVDYPEKSDEIELLDTIGNAHREILTTEQITQIVDQARKFRRHADQQRGWPRVSPADLLKVFEEYDRAENLEGAMVETVKGLCSARDDTEAVTEAARDLPAVN